MASSSLPPSLWVFAQSYLLIEPRPNRLISYWNLSRTLTLTHPSYPGPIPLNFLERSFSAVLGSFLFSALPCWTSAPGEQGPGLA